MLQHITHILLDAARMADKIETAKELNATHDSLYRGGSEESLSSVAPYIFRFQNNSEFAQWFMENGWGNSWGLMIKSNFSLPELHKHFRKFLLVATEDGKKLYFRFYDPRVLRIFLPTCNATQIRELFELVDYFLMEDENPEFVLKFWQENGILKSQKITVSVWQKSDISIRAEALKLEPKISTEKNIPAAKIAVRKPSETPVLPDEKAKKNGKSKWNMFD